MTITLPLDSDGAAEHTSLPAVEKPRSSIWLECQSVGLDAEAYYRELAALSDEELRKRGIERSGIAKAVHERFFERR